MNIVVDKIISNWLWVHCQDVIDVRDGTHDTPKYVQKGVPLVTSKNLTKKGIDFKNTYYISYEDHELIKKRSKVDKGDILFSMIGTIGNPVIVRSNEEFSIKNVALFKFSNSNVCLEYFYYLLESQIITKQLDSGSRGGLQKFVSLDTLRSLKIPLPPLPEQRRIAAILEQADKLRQLRREADEKAEKLLPALFDEMFGEINPRKKYPEGWIQTSLSSVIIDSQYGTSTSLQDEGDVAVLRMNNITLDGWLDFSNIKYLPNKAIDWNMYSLEPGDILFNRTNSKELVGKTALWDQDEKQKFSFASYIIRIRLDQEKVLPEYIWALLNSHYGKTNLFRLAKQAVNMANINTQELGSIPIVIPPLPLQKKFSLLLKSFKEKLFLHKQSMDSIEKLFQSLLSQAFTGELTATWREKHADELAKAAQERDELLAKEQIRLTTPAKNTQDISQLTLGQHHQLYNSFLMELKSSEQQYKVYQAAISEAKYFTAETLTEKIDLLSTTFVKHSLELFEAAGLIIKVSIPSYITGETRFVSAYRALWPKDISLDDEFVDNKNYDSLDGSKIESL
jgi:type I restriction enzyme, S subunit